MKVLLIAADAGLRENLLFALGQTGPFQVLLAQDCHEAACLPGREQVDVAIVDLREPGRAGLAMLREARAALPGIPLAAVAMRVYGEYRSACVAAGATCVVDKSGELQDLLQVIRSLGLAGAGGQASTKGCK